MTTIEQVIDYTNAKLNNWYANAKADYDIEGEGVCTHKDGLIVIDYKENGEQKQWSYGFYNDQAQDYWFNIWTEEA